MKRFLLLIPCICLFLCACGGNDEHSYYMEEEITAFVLEHEDEIRDQIDHAGDDGRITALDETFDVTDRRDSHGVIYYEYAASGLMTASVQAGFYYSAEDTPSSYGGASWAGGYGWEEIPMPEENLWRYEETGSDNYLITRKICNNFYYVIAGN